MTIIAKLRDVCCSVTSHSHAFTSTTLVIFTLRKQPFLDTTKLSDEEQEICDQVLKEMAARVEARLMRALEGDLYVQPWGFY